MSGGGQSPVSALSASLAELPHLPRTQLVELWAKHVGCPPPKAASTPLLLRAVAYAVQEQQLGGLKRQELRLLHKSTQPGEIRANGQRAPNSKMRAGHKPSPSNGDTGSRPCGKTAPTAVRMALRPGTRLVREWQGKSHSVDVRADGFAWNGTGIRHAYIKPSSPQLNGKVERSHRTDEQEFYQLLTSHLELKFISL